MHTSGCKPHGHPDLVSLEVPRFSSSSSSSKSSSLPSLFPCNSSSIRAQQASASNRNPLPPIDIHLLRTVGPLAQLSLWFANWASILPVTTPSVWTTRSVLPQPISNLSLTLTPAVACRWSTFSLCATCHRPINYYYSFILFLVCSTPLRVAVFPRSSALDQGACILDVIAAP